MYLHLKKIANLSIQNDFNMIIEEYGLWEKCTAKDQKMIVDFLFGDIVEEMTFILFGCESAFVSNFIVSFAFRKVYAGEVLQYAQQESCELFIVWQGAVAVCETT